MQSYILLSVIFFLDGTYMIPMPDVFDSVTKCSEQLMKDASNPHDAGAVTITPQPVGKYMYRIDYTNHKSKDTYI